MAENNQVAARGGSGTAESSLLPPSAFFVPTSRREAAVTASHLEAADSRRGAAPQRRRQVKETSITEHCSDDEETEVLVSPMGKSTRKQTSHKTRRKSSPDITAGTTPCCAAAITLRHLEEMVLRQAAEIVSLQSNLAEERRRLQSMQSASELSITTAEQRWAGVVKQLEGELSSTRATLHAELNAVRASYDRNIAAKDSDLARVTELLESTVQQKDAQLQATVTQLADVRQQCDVLAEQKAAEAREASKALAARDATIAQLKVYLGEQQSQAAEYSHWSAEKAALVSKLQESQQAQDSLSATVELLNVRLRSLEEIISIHEKEFACNAGGKDTTVIAIQQSEVGNERSLLTRWREKVYELLVQRKSLEIAIKKDEAAWKAKVAAVEHDVHAVRMQCEVMARQLQDKDARLQLERQARQAAERLHEQALNRTSAAHHESELANRSCDLLCKSLKQWHAWHSNAEKTIVQSVDVMKTLSQRLHYAAGRVKLVEAYLVRQKKVKLAKQSEQETAASSSATAAPGTSSLDGNVCGRLSCNDDCRVAASAEADAFVSCRSELELVTKERDALAVRLQEDACLFESTLVDLKRQHAAQAAELQTKIESLEEVIKSKNERLSALTVLRSDLESELERSKLRAAELSHTVDALSQDLREVEDRAKQASDDSWSERLVACQRQLTEARAQLAKAEVSASRMERERVRERTQLRDQLAEAQRACCDVTERLEVKNESLRSECNMLMTIIRQEGLLSKLKSARLLPRDAAAILATGDDHLDKQRRLDSADSTLLGSVEKLTMELLGPAEQSPGDPHFIEDDQST